MPAHWTSYLRLLSLLDVLSDARLAELMIACALDPRSLREVFVANRAHRALRFLRHHLLAARLEQEDSDPRGDHNDRQQGRALAHAEGSYGND